MHKKPFVLLFIISACLFLGAEPAADADKSDSSKVYREIKTFSKKSAFTRFLYGLVFRQAAKPPAKQKPYRHFEGKIIRNINVVTLDPFGFSLDDSSVISENYLSRMGNDLHVKTRPSIPRNLLFIHEREPFDSLSARESERLIRNQKYIREVSFLPILTENKDSVDIFIVTRDAWSIIPKGSLSSVRATVDLTEKNFVGAGHEFENAYTFNHTDGSTAFKTHYLVPNIRNTYITAALHYEIDEFKNLNQSVAVERPFFSPLANWAGGLTWAREYRHDSVSTLPSTFVPQIFNFNTQDYWAGSALHLSRGQTEDERATNLILTGRYLRIRYLEKPPPLYDSIAFYADENFYLSGIGVSTRKYVRDRYIFNYGAVEDVPVGQSYGVVGGYQSKSVGREYWGLRYSIGDFYPWGYFGTNLEYGTFMSKSNFEQGAFTAGMHYLSRLAEFGDWKFRQLVKPQFAMGIHRLPGERLTINEENGIQGFNSPVVTGTKKLVLTLQSQSYSPWSILGFRIGPYLIYSVGMVGNDASNFKNSGVYSQLGLGALIKNDFLVFNLFQVSVAFYPIIPGVGENIFEFNPYNTADFGLHDFDIGKPAIVDYR